jgi:hypothetical protein
VVFKNDQRLNTGYNFDCQTSQGKLGIIDEIQK